MTPEAITDDRLAAHVAERELGGAMSIHRGSWPVTMALLALSAIPLTAGTLRLLQLAGGPVVIPADHRFDAFPLPLVVHIVAAATYALLGILQFVPRFRRSHPIWHRRVGRISVAAGLIVAISALSLTLFYEAQPGTGDVLFVLRLAFGSAMAACLVLGVTAVYHGDIAAHRAWMVRAYAIGLAAGTQAFTEGLGAAIFGTSVLAKGAGWVANLAVAEWSLRRPAIHRTAPIIGDFLLTNSRAARSRPGLPVGLGKPVDRFGPDTQRREMTMGPTGQGRGSR
jgi:uncharacterized membrane protein